MQKASRFVLYFFAVFLKFVNGSNIELLECEPPDYPLWGGYGPRQDYYIPGDTIHYYCDVDAYIAGNNHRVCMDHGDWSGDTPVCDPPTSFSSVEQSSTDEPLDLNGAESASDGIRTTCSSTLPEEGATWTGTFEQPSHVFRVMLFLPKVELAYEVLLVKEDGLEYSCGNAQRTIERYEWNFHSCLGMNYTDVVAIKIKSLSSAALQLCEVVVHALTDPSCVDPHIYIENGQLILTRKKANLVCHRGYTRGREKRIDCVQPGVWTRKSLHCIEMEIDNVPEVTELGTEASVNLRREEEISELNSRNRERE